MAPQDARGRKEPTEDHEEGSPTLGFAGASTVVASHSLPLGAVLLNTYEIERFLTRGGMGEVYVARHTALGSKHAIKVINPELLNDETIVALAQREATVLRDIRHDAVVGYEGYFCDSDGRHFLVMEYVEGPSMAEVLKEVRFSTPEVLMLRDRLAAGLIAAHDKKVVHRDLSPDNVILPGGSVESAKIIDFGVAKLTDTAAKTIIGTRFAGKLRYASPEQLGMVGGEVDVRSDIYSLGLLLATASAGQPLDMGDTFESVVAAREQVPDLSPVAAELRPQISAMLQPRPADRPGSLYEVLTRWPGSDRPYERRRSPRFGEPPSARRERHSLRRGSQQAGSGLKGRVLAMLSVAGVISIAAAGYVAYILLSPDPVEPTTDTPAPTAVVLSIEEIASRPWEELSTYLGEFVARGQLVKAFELLKEARRQGHQLPPQSTHNLARQMLDEGQSDMGFALMRELAVGGYAPSSLVVGELYDPGSWKADRSPFSKPNAMQAEKWYRLAIEQGSEEAPIRLQALEESGYSQ